MPPIGSGSGRFNFHAVYDDESGAVCFVLQGFSPTYNFVKAVLSADGEGVCLIDPQTRSQEPIEWRGGYATQTGIARRDEDDAWYFQTFDGEETPLGFTSSANVYAIRPDCWFEQDTGAHPDAVPERRNRSPNGGLRRLGGG